MNLTRILKSVVILLILALLLMPVGQASAKMIKTPFTGTDTLLEDLDPGIETFPGKDRYHVRDNVFTTTVVTTDPRVSGTMLFTSFNANFKLVDPPVYVTGRMWGTFILPYTGGEVDDYWEGTITGVRYENGYSYFKYVAHGHGAYAGMQLRMNYAREDADPSVPGILTGYVLEPEA